MIPVFKVVKFEVWPWGFTVYGLLFWGKIQIQPPLDGETAEVRLKQNRRTLEILGKLDGDKAKKESAEELLRFLSCVCCGFITCQTCLVTILTHETMSWSVGSNLHRPLHDCLLQGWLALQIGLARPLSCQWRLSRLPSLSSWWMPWLPTLLCSTNTFLCQWNLNDQRNHVGQEYHVLQTFAWVCSCFITCWSLCWLHWQAGWQSLVSQTYKQSDRELGQRKDWFRIQFQVGLV